MLARSWLFTPADSEKKIEKALSSPADIVIVDLEDSVVLARKEAGRQIASDALAVRDDVGPRVFLRINALQTPYARDDIAAIASLDCEGVVLPKASADGVRDLGAFLDKTGVNPKTQILAIATETPSAIFQLGSYAGTSDRLSALTWGAEDLSASVGASAVRDSNGAFFEPWRLVRALTLFGAAAAEVEAVDSVFTDIRDLEGLKAEALAARRDGFTGKLAIHPAQVPVINDAFVWSDDEVSWARAVKAAFEDSPDAGTLQLDGQMLDRPHLKKAHRILGTSLGRNGID